MDWIYSYYLSQATHILLLCKLLWIIKKHPDTYISSPKCVWIRGGVEISLGQNAFLIKWCITLTNILRNMVAVTIRLVLRTPLDISILQTRNILFLFQFIGDCQCFGPQVPEGKFSQFLWQRYRWFILLKCIKIFSFNCNFRAVNATPCSFIILSALFLLQNFCNSIWLDRSLTTGHYPNALNIWSIFLIWCHVLKNCVWLFFPLRRSLSLTLTLLSIRVFHIFSTKLMHLSYSFLKVYISMKMTFHLICILPCHFYTYEILF